MGIQNWSENVILVNLAEEPYLGEELQTVTGMLYRQDGIGCGHRFFRDVADYLFEFGQAAQTAQNPG